MLTREKYNLSTKLTMAVVGVKSSSQSRCAITQLLPLNIPSIILEASMHTCESGVS